MPSKLHNRIASLLKISKFWLSNNHVNIVPFLFWGIPMKRDDEKNIKLFIVKISQIPLCSFWVNYCIIHIISSNLHSFVRGRSTTTNLVGTSYTICVEVLGNQKQMDVVYMQRCFSATEIEINFSICTSLLCSMKNIYMNSRLL